MDFSAFRARLEALDDIDAMRSEMSACVRALGYHGFDAYSLAQADLPSPIKPTNAFLCDYGLERIMPYFDDGWLQMDPVIQEVGRSMEPFDYLAFIRTCPVNASVLWQRAALLAAGVGHAWCVPFNTVGRIQGMTWYMRGAGKGQRAQFEKTRDTVQQMTTIFMPRFVERALELETDAPSPRAALTAREGDCLHWVAQGKTNWEIGTILAISENTVRYHLKNAYRKLGANSRGIAVNRAMQQGVLR